MEINKEMNWDIEKLIFIFLLIKIELIISKVGNCSSNSLSNVQSNNQILSIIGLAQRAAKVTNIGQLEIYLGVVLCQDAGGPKMVAD